jgi:uncharacterized UBP type Zn finger protein
VDYVAGYAQQDAHEFLIAFLNSLDCQLRAAGESLEIDDFTEIFTGKVQSELRCTVCNSSSVMQENFVDLSLTVNRHNNAVLSSSLSDDNEMSIDGPNDIGEVDLFQSLEAFTSTETLRDKGVRIIKQVTFKLVVL